MKNRSWLERVFHMWPVKVLSLGAAVLLFFFTNLLNLGTREITVPIHYQLAPGFTQASEFPTKARLILRGDTDKLYGLAEDELSISADFTKHAHEGQFQTALRLQRNGAAAAIEPFDVQIFPSTVKVTLEPSVSRDMPVNVRFSGNPKPGFQLVAYSIAPKSLRLSGPASRMANVTSIDTEPVDLSVRSQDFVQRIAISSPDPLVRVSGSDALEVRVTIGETAEKRTFANLPLSIIGLSPDLTFEPSVPEGTVIVQADSQTLAAISPEQIRVLVDASQIKSPGTYRLKAICDPPDGVLVLSVDPQNISLVVGQMASDRSKL